MEATEKKRPFLDCVLKTNESRQRRQLPLLFSVYTTNRIGCMNIFESGNISGKKYDLPGQNESITASDFEKCVVLFYGNPVYLGNRDTGNELVTNSSCLPCCLILNTFRIYPKHIFPFDMNSCPKGMDISDFELSSSVLNIPAYVKRYFSNNNNYLHGKSTKGSIPMTSLAEEMLWSLLTDINKTEEAKTVEIFCEDFDLNNVIEAIIVPKTMLKEDDYKKFKENHNQIDVLAYDARYPCVPNDCRGIIYDQLMKYYRKKKVLK